MIEEVQAAMLGSAHYSNQEVGVVAIYPRYVAIARAMTAFISPRDCPLVDNPH
jgi:hypothetical protein